MINYIFELEKDAIERCEKCCICNRKTIFSNHLSFYCKSCKIEQEFIPGLKFQHLIICYTKNNFVLEFNSNSVLLINNSQEIDICQIKDYPITNKLDVKNIINDIGKYISII